MKKTILLVVCALLGVLTVSAQQRMVRVYTQNGVDKKDTIEVWRIDEIKFIADTVASLNDKPDTLDFGLSVRWADRNMGAASPKDPGRLIGWGDTTLTNYSKKQQYFPVENHSGDISKTQYDVAAVKWDDKWHMPTAEEIQELINACEWTWVNDAENDSVGVLGSLTTDKTKTIFFPVTGKRKGDTAAEETLKGFYWTGSIGTSDAARAYTFSAEAATPVFNNYLRYIGLAIRPVAGPVIVVIPTGIGTVTTTSVEALKATVTATLTGDLQDAQKVVISYGVSQSDLSYSEIEDDGHRIADVAGTIVMNLTGLSQNTTYYVKVYVKRTDNSLLESQAYSFKTEKLAQYPVAEAIDLGLPSGVKWASWNMGSSSPMDVPNTKYARYGWGDPTGEVHTNYTNDYAVSHDSKFSTRSIDIAGSQYDIATTQWGKGWRLPRKADFEELISKCTIVRGTHTDDNGKSRYGYKLTGPNGNSIMIPAAGYVNSTGELRGDNSSMVYWMSSNNLGADISAQVLYTSSVQDMQAAIYYQIPIRPVYDISSSQGSGSQSGEELKPETSAAGKGVDLGLSVLWADRNVGSTVETSVGNYYAWGDTQTRDTYSESTYVHYKDNAYVVDGMYPKFTLDYDVAYQQWGGEWHMPTKNDWNELINGCDWVEEGSGYRIYKKGSRKKNESIYLPVSGYKVTGNGSTHINNSDYCNYWSSAINTHVDSHWSEAYSIMNKPGGTKNGAWTSSRYEGLPVRPVKNK